MIVNFEKSEISIDCRLINDSFNVKATSYIEKNYENLLKYCCRLVKEKGSDLLHDVYLSCRSNEITGNSFNENYDKESSITIEEFIYNRLKLYSKNSKYNSNYIESKSNSDSPIYITASSFIGDDLDQASSFQKAYMTAESIDNIGDIDSRLDIQRDIDTVLDIASLHKCDSLVINVLKNISKAAEAPSSVLKPISDLVFANSDVSEALVNIIKFSASNNSAYKTLVCNL